MGAGYSAIEGINLARGEFLYGPGADLEYKMEDVYKMIDKIERENLDAVFGSRLLEKREISRYQLIKERPYWFSTLITTSLINILYHRGFTDVIGTNLVKTNILKYLNCNYSSQAFAFELISKLCKKGYKIEEVPIWYKPRKHKNGKTIKVLDMIPALFTIFKVKFFN